MNIYEMTRREFEKLPRRKWREIIECDSIIILPARFDWWGVVKYKVRQCLARLFRTTMPETWEVGHLHDSGFRRMDFVAVQGCKPICLLSGCSDVIHFDGIGGLGYRWLEKYGTVPQLIPPSAWNMDCLPSGLLRLWTGRGKIICGPALSSFEIFAVNADEEKDYGRVD